MREDSEKNAVDTCAEVQREKSWDELRDSEKIDRMRLIIKARQSDNDRLLNRIYVLEHKLSLHRHDSDGKILVPLDSVDSLTRSLDVSKPSMNIHGKEWF